MSAPRPALPARYEHAEERTSRDGRWTWAAQRRGEGRDGLVFVKAVRARAWRQPPYAGVPVHPALARPTDDWWEEDPALGGLHWYESPLWTADAATWSTHLGAERGHDDLVRALESLLQVLVDVCAGLEHLHAHGLVHRDVSADNVLVREVDAPPGVQAALADLDAVVAEGTLSRPAGKPGRLPPEWADPGAEYPATSAADVHLCGLMAHELLDALWRPHDPAHRVTSAPDAPALVLQPFVASLHPVLDRARRRTPEARPTTAELRRHLTAFRDALVDYREGRVAAPHDGLSRELLRSTAPRARRRRQVLVGAAVLVLAMTAGAAVGRESTGPSPAPPPTAAVGECQAFPPRVSVPVRARALSTRAVDAREDGGRWQLRAADYEPTGLLIELPPGLCDYELEVDVVQGRAVVREPGYGWGYGVGACNHWTPNGADGLLVQAGLYLGDAGAVVPVPQALPMPRFNDGWPVEGLAVEEGGALRWTLRVRGDRVRVRTGYGQPLTATLPGGVRTDDLPLVGVEEELPSSCGDADAFLRVYNSEVTVDRIRITTLAS